MPDGLPAVKTLTTAQFRADIQLKLLVVQHYDLTTAMMALARRYLHHQVQVADGNAASYQIACATMSKFAEAS
ncbi:hypothetical protein [Bradyrhizobium sp. Ai1a-2]|uniref:hypothetical protein n=1 Tax=Bradyrhizobium sp. Ai1a-2 TaxID=196490 RepID=UPI001267FA72|nr:hypothetical protein [Bradyrhizobium sp. Ai1a-2]